METSDFQKNSVITRESYPMVRPVLSFQFSKRTGRRYKTNSIYNLRAPKNSLLRYYILLYLRKRQLSPIRTRKNVIKINYLRYLILTFEKRNLLLVCFFHAALIDEKIKTCRKVRDKTTRFISYMKRNKSTEPGVSAKTIINYLVIIKIGIEIFLLLSR